ncbi:MAG TPA: hypothetical protein VN960_09375 [Gaiellaceae bacterium]|nr:hypothetical protein [Gaiellaceae bacterium]
MVELRRSGMHVVRCLARPETLDALPEITGIHACHVAPDELLLIGQPAEVDLPEGLAVNETGGWAAWTLSGRDAGEVLARLSMLPPGLGFLQGTVAGVPAKAIVSEEEIHLLVAASLGHHVEERFRAACSDVLAT